MELLGYITIFISLIWKPVLVIAVIIMLASFFDEVEDILIDKDIT